MGGSGTGTPVEAPTGDSYITVATADTYFDTQFNIADWNAASTGDKTKTLAMATAAIEQLNFLGEKADADQTFEFPRWDDDDIPQPVQDACAELALAFIKGVDEDAEYESMRIISEGMDTMRVTHNPKFVSLHTVNGIYSIKAWRLLVPYMRDNKTMVIDKIP